MIDLGGELSPALVEALAAVGPGDGPGQIVMHGQTVTSTGPHDLCVQLTRTFYEQLHLGWETPRHISTVHRDVRLERDLADALELPPAILHAAELPPVPGATDPVVMLDGVRVLVPPGDVVARTVSGAAPQVGFRRPPLRAAVSPGFLLLDRSDGHPDARLDQRIYVHVEDPAAAPALWAAVVGALDAAGAAYVTKASSVRSQYGRTDAIVVYRDGTDPDVVGTLVDAVTGRPGLGRTTSAFAAREGTGVSTATEPADDRPGMVGLSFGLHRAALLARAVVRSRYDGHDLRTAAVDELMAGRVDPLDLAKNIQPPRGGTYS